MPPMCGAGPPAPSGPAWLEEFSSCFMRKLWCLEMSILSRFWRILGFLFLGCGGVCHCQFGTDLALVE